MMQYMTFRQAAKELRNRNYTIMMPNSFYTTGTYFCDDLWNSIPME